MTTLVAMALTTLVLAALFYPLFVEARVLARSGRGRASMELEEAYRSALADLQDLQNDWEAGAIAQSDYDTLRDRYRTRAAEALRALSVGEENVGPLVAQVEQGAAVAPLIQPHKSGSSVSVVRAPAPGTEPTENLRPLVSAASHGVVQEPIISHVDRRGASSSAAVYTRSFRWAIPRPVLVAGVLAVLGVGGVTALYVQQVSQQAAQAPRATLEVAHAHSALIDPSGVLWIGHHDGLVRSTDGRVWSTTGVRSDVMAVVPLSPERRLVFGHDVLLSVGSDGSVSPLAHDLPGTDVHGADLGIGGVVIYVVGAGIFRSVDGERWEFLAPSVPQNVGSLAILAPPGGDTLFLAVGGTVARSVDLGRTWSAAAGAAGLALAGTTRSIAADRETGMLYAASSEGLFRSRNLGADWQKLPFRGTASAVGARGQRLVVVDDDGRVFVSIDGGATWPAVP